MGNALQAADTIHAEALQILNHYGVEPQEVPLVMGYVTQRLECFAVGDMAREIAELKAARAADDEENQEVDNG